MNGTLIILISALLIGSCNTSKDVQDKKNEDSSKLDKTINPPDKHPESKSPDNMSIITDSVDLVITFSSRGEGINGKAVKTLDSFISEFESENNKSIKYDLNNWGREGEKDYCIDLENLSSEKRDLFASQVKRLLEDENLVTISENTLCPRH